MTGVIVDTTDFRVSFGKILALSAKPRTIVQAACRAARTTLQRHFRMRDRMPNKLGGRRTHFWLDIYKSTQLGEVTDRYGILRIGDSRMAQKVYGGPIVAKNVRNLSIPVNPAAHGMRPAVFEREAGVKLFFVKGHNQGLLAHRIGDGYLAELKVDYVLTPRVDQDADPNALPPMQKLETDALTAAAKQLAVEVEATQTKR